ncbi:serine protease SSP1-like [Convolutriloba macropyga]|uniref:serine protease SSP1-like n=1 Tax=Convolutriloba macropyga TaxID=536237 RepID=UPI003F527292
MFCGGTVIHRRWVITAAHCLLNSQADDIVVEVGDFTQGRQKRLFHVEHIILHEHFHVVGGRPVNDIALLHLTTPALRVNEPRLNLCHLNHPIGTRLVASGMGSLSRTGVNLPNRLQQSYLIEIPHLPTRTNPTVEPVECPENSICTESITIGGDLGKFDDGGPLFAITCLFGYNIPCLYGVASYTLMHPILVENLASVFTSVPDNHLWIISKLALF